MVELLLFDESIIILTIQIIRSDCSINCEFMPFFKLNTQTQQPRNEIKYIIHNLFGFSDFNYITLIAMRPLCMKT